MLAIVIVGEEQMIFDVQRNGEPAFWYGSGQASDGMDIELKLKRLTGQSNR